MEAEANFNQIIIQSKGQRMRHLRIVRSLGCCLLAVIFLSGCAVVIQKGRRSDLDKIESLKSELDELKDAKSLLEGKLAQEIKDKQVKLEMQERGLVITVVAE